MQLPGQILCVILWAEVNVEENLPQGIFSVQSGSSDQTVSVLHLSDASYSVEQYDLNKIGLCPDF